MLEITPTSEQLTEINNELLIKNIQYIKQCQSLMDKLEIEMADMGKAIEKTKSWKLKTQLLVARSRLHKQYGDILQSATICFCAAYKPLSNINRYIEQSSHIEPIEPQSLPSSEEIEIDIQSIYKKYQD